MEDVRPRLGHGVDQAAREASLPDVERGDEHLVLPHRLDRDRMGVGLTARRTGRGEPEHVVVHSAVDLDRVEAIVLATERRAGYARGHHLRDRLDEIGEVAGQGGQPVDRTVGHERLGARPGPRHERVGLGFDGYPGHFDRDALEAQILAEPLAEPQVDAGNLPRLEAERPHVERVRTAHLDVLEEIAAVFGRARGIALTRRGVRERDEGGSHGGAGIIGKAARDRGRGHPLPRERAHGERGDGRQDAGGPDHTLH